jgi:molybdate transport system substrate-binding protein
MLILLPLLLAATVAGSAPERSVHVFAAASLKDAMTEIARGFERENKGVKVVLSFAGSQQLAAQIQFGAPADVFASASPQHMDKVEYVKSTRRVLTGNRLVVAVPRTSTLVSSLANLPKAQRIVIAAAPVPAGGYTRSMLAKAARRFGEDWKRAVLARVVSAENDVRSVLAKVALGEADAGIVYSSDALSAKDKVRAISIPDALNEIAVYPIAVVAGSKSQAAAKSFVSFSVSAKGQAALKKWGFEPPRPSKPARKG